MTYPAADVVRLLGLQKYRYGYNFEPFSKVVFSSHIEAYTRSALSLQNNVSEYVQEETTFPDVSLSYYSVSKLFCQNPPPRNVPSVSVVNVIQNNNKGELSKTTPTQGNEIGSGVRIDLAKNLYVSAGLYYRVDPPKEMPTDPGIIHRGVDEHGGTIKVGFDF